MAPKLPKYHAGQKRRTVSLSFSVPTELEAPMNQAAALRGMNRSEYITWLVRRHLEELPSLGTLPKVPEAPIRIRRKPSSS